MAVNQNMVQREVFVNYRDPRKAEVGLSAYHGFSVELAILRQLICFSSVLYVKRHNTHVARLGF